MKRPVVYKSKLLYFSNISRYNSLLSHSVSVSDVMAEMKIESKIIEDNIRFHFHFREGEELSTEVFDGCSDMIQVLVHDQEAIVDIGDGLHINRRVSILSDNSAI